MTDSSDPATRDTAACPGSGGGYDEVYGWDRHTAEYWERCELCGRGHEDNRPVRSLWERLRGSLPLWAR